MASIRTTGVDRFCDKCFRPLLIMDPEDGGFHVRNAVTWVMTCKTGEHGPTENILSDVYCNLCYPNGRTKVSERKGKIVAFKSGSNDLWYFHMQGVNGEIITASEGYTRKSSMMDTLKEYFPNWEIEYQEIPSSNEEEV